MRRGAALLLLAAVSASAVSLRRGFLDNDMRPEVVAHTLVKVAQEWRSQVSIFVECSNLTDVAQQDCKAATQAFHKSCATVVSAMVHASGGDRRVAAEYMGDVCAQSALTGWPTQVCRSLATSVSDAMTADERYNRDDLSLDGVCTAFWGRFTADEKARVERQRAGRDAEEKRLAAEQAEAERRRAEEEKAAAGAEEERRKQEAALQAAEAARRRAEEATAKLQEQRRAAASEVATAAASPAATTPAESANATSNATATATVVAAVVVPQHATVTTANATAANQSNQSNPSVAA
mmetsp:Transcript_81698/g.210335  ORF Transcript_81698/g.210335 Transcript_81698/m.210335 type:complete len:294 (-) Transcript_81698:24-905(-)